MQRKSPLMVVSYLSGPWAVGLEGDRLCELERLRGRGGVRGRQSGHQTGPGGGREVRCVCVYVRVCVCVCEWIN